MIARLFNHETGARDATAAMLAHMSHARAAHMSHARAAHLSHAKAAVIAVATGATTGAARAAMKVGVRAATNAAGANPRASNRASHAVKTANLNRARTSLTAIHYPRPNPRKNPSVSLAGSKDSSAARKKPRHRTPTPRLRRLMIPAVMDAMAAPVTTVVAAAIAVTSAVRAIPMANSRQAGVNPEGKVSTTTNSAARAAAVVAAVAVPAVRVAASAEVTVAGRAPRGQRVNKAAVPSKRLKVFRVSFR